MNKVVKKTATHAIKTISSSGLLSVILSPHKKSADMLVHRKHTYPFKAIGFN